MLIVGSVLVTGASGFIGSNLVKALDDRDVITLGRSHPQRIANHICADIRKHFSIPQTEIRTIYHLAGIAGTSRSKNDLNNTYLTNVTGTYNTLVAAAATGIQNLVYVSSTQVYESLKLRVVYEDDCINFDELVSGYARSKKAAEDLVLTFSELFGINVCIVRLGVVYGPGLTAPNSIYSMTKSAIQTGDIQAANTTRSYLYIKDCIDALIRCESKTGIYNIDGGIQVSLPDLAQIIAELIPATITVKPGDPWPLVSIDKARAELGWSPKTTIYSKLWEFVEYMNDRYP